MKVTVVGAGNVGASVAQRVAEAGLADVVMMDVLEGMPQGKALDLAQAAPLLPHDCTLVGANDYQATVWSDLVVITAGVPRKPGMTRMDLLKTNAEIVRGVAEQVMRTSPQAIVIVVSNPLDVMTHLTWKVTGFSPERVVGMAGVLDSARFRAFIAMELGVSVEDVQAMVLGGHGDAMVPLPRFATVAGIPITHFMDQATIDRLIDRTRKAGTEIVALLKTGSAYYAPAAAAFEMVESVLRDRKRVLPCCALCQGEYRLQGIYVGVPLRLGRWGVEQIIELPLTEEELAALHRSTAEVQEGVKELGL